MKFDLNIADFFKLPIKIMAALAIATAGILFSPTLIAEKMYITSFRDEYGFIIGIIFITSIAILSINLIAFIFQIIVDIISNRRFEKKSKEIIRNLTDYQKFIVYLLYSQNNFTHELPLNDGAVLFLQNNLIITRVTNEYVVDMINPMFPFVLQPWAVKELEDDSELLLSFERTVSKQI